MNPPDLNLATASAAQLVPAGFAEKAMASLMQMHHELVAEKERRVQLYRTLMQKEQSLAELAMYVRVLEERLGELEAVATPLEPAVTAPIAAAPATAAPEPVRRAPAQAPSPAAPRASQTPEPVAVAPAASHARAGQRPAGDGWKVW